MNPRDWTPKQQLERGIAAGVLVLVLVWPIFFGTYWSHQILIETFLFGIAAASGLVYLTVGVTACLKHMWAVYVGLVAERPLPPVRMPSVRNL